MQECNGGEMAVTCVLTKRSGTLVEFQHALRSETGQENKHDLHCLSHSVKKLQNDVNSCLTEIIKQETTTVGNQSASDFKGISFLFLFFPLNYKDFY